MALLGQLKAQTADCHQRLETSMDVFRRVRTESDYKVLLQRFLTLYEPLEAKLAAAAVWEGVEWDFEARRKAPWLHEDLRALGVDAAEVGSWPRATMLPALESFGAAVGTLYVIEGSTLGGQVISRQFGELLGVTPLRGGKFFHGYGENTGRQWRQFGQWAEHQASKAPIVETAVRGARDTFEAFAGWMTQ